MSSTTESLDPYLYPGTTVLKNLRGLTDPGKLAAFEARSTHRRLTELLEAPLSGGFDTAHLRAIHRYIFQDVFEWAGRLRIVDISKDGNLFGRAAFVETALEQTLELKSSSLRTTSRPWTRTSSPSAPLIISAS